MPTYHAKLTTGKWLDPYTRNELRIKIESAIRETLNVSFEDARAYIDLDPIKE